jgi:hypothetical protein
MSGNGDDPLHAARLGADDSSITIALLDSTDALHTSAHTSVREHRGAGLVTSAMRAGRP